MVYRATDFGGSGLKSVFPTAPLITMSAQPQKHRVRKAEPGGATQHSFPP